MPTMLPEALKAVWFCLSFTGMISSWLVLYIFTRVIGCHWIMFYGVFATLMQGIFCLGMIWNMNPFQMPKEFCIAQTIIIYYAAWSLTGVCAAFTFATTSTVLWPSSVRLSAASPLVWNNKYYLPIFGFPLACLSISLPVLLKVNAIQPTEDLHCDASRPEWGRFLGYAGISLILTIPCFFLSAAAARRVLQMHLHNQRTAFTARHQSRTNFSQITGRDVAPQTAKSPVSAQNLFSAAPLDSETPFSSESSKTALTTPDADDQSVIRYSDTGDELADIPASATFGQIPHPQKTPAQWTVTSTIDEEEELGGDGRRQTVAIVMTSSLPRAIANKPTNFAPAIWRLIIFQMAFFLIECLAALSTIIDVATHRPTPTPFGSQHVALILVGWGPAIVFGHLPAVRRQLMFWKRR